MKNSVKDYQWPSFFIRSNQKYNIKYQKKIDLKLINELENYFQKYYGFKIKSFFDLTRNTVRGIICLKLKHSEPYM